MDTPLDKARKAMSGQTTHDRVAAAERAVTNPKANPPARAQKSMPTLKVAPKHAAARKQRIAAAQAADRAAIAARGKQK